MGRKCRGWDARSGSPRRAVTDHVFRAIEEARAEGNEDEVDRWEVAALHLRSVWDLAYARLTWRAAWTDRDTLTLLCQIAGHARSGCELCQRPETLRLWAIVLEWFGPEMRRLLRLLGARRVARRRR